VNIMVDVVKGEGVAKGKELPDRLPLGRDCLESVREIYTKHLQLCDEWESVIVSSDFEEPEKAGI